MQHNERVDLALTKLQESENAKRLTLDLLKASVEKWKEESIGATQSEVERYHGAIIHTRTLINSIEQDFKSFELQSQSYN